MPPTLAVLSIILVLEMDNFDGVFASVIILKCMLHCSLFVFVFVFVFYFSGYNSITQINNLQGLQTITTLDTEIQNTKQPRRITKRNSVSVEGFSKLNGIHVNNKYNILIIIKS